MKISEEKKLEILAYEAILRRAVQLEHPFMLKGSYVTRQYFNDPDLRIPNDLDWVYLRHLDYEDEATDTFNVWLEQITTLPEYDGVRFRTFSENRFWRMMDYAMGDDFPTVNTDLCCWVDGAEISSLHLDISFNLPVNVPAKPFLYTPLRGEPFTIPNTAPLVIQVSWKLHQTMVRARFKDLFDLMHLVVHPEFTADVMEQSIAELVKECALDNTDPFRLSYLLNGDWEEIFHIKTVELVWDYWRHEKRDYYSGYIPGEYETAGQITDSAKLPETLREFIEQFRQAFETAGFYKTDIREVINRFADVKAEGYFSDEAKPLLSSPVSKQISLTQFVKSWFNKKK